MGRTGLIHYLDGSIEKGHLREGRLHGVGVSTTPNSSRYEGEFESGVKQGFGTYYNFFEGCTYTGQWLKGKKHGLGKFSMVSGQSKEIIFGSWMDGELIRTFDVDLLQPLEPQLLAIEN